MDNTEYQFPYIVDPKHELERKRKRSFRKFWGMWVPLAFIASLVLSIICNNGGLFLPVWGILTLIFAGIDDEDVQ